MALVGRGSGTVTLDVVWVVDFVCFGAFMGPGRSSTLGLRFVAAGGGGGVVDFVEVGGVGVDNKRARG